MTRAHILGPPHSSRKVLTEQQFLEEMRQLQAQKGQSDQIEVVAPKLKNAQLNPQTEPVPYKRSSQCTANDYFIAPGRFSVRTIQDDVDKLVFYDLELPMGTWKELSLDKLAQSDALPQNPIKEPSQRKFVDWIHPKHSKVRGLPPANVLYGLAAVCYIGQAHLSLAGAVRDVLAYDGTPPFTATLMDYTPNGTDIVHVGMGWSRGHPFAKTYKSCLLGGTIESEISKDNAVNDPSLQTILFDLLGETIPDRCKRILEWVTDGFDAKILGTSRHGYAPVYFGLYDGSDATIFANIPFDDEKHPARFITAHPKYFERK